MFKVCSDCIHYSVCYARQTIEKDTKLMAILLKDDTHPDNIASICQSFKTNGKDKIYKRY